MDISCLPLFSLDIVWFTACSYKDCFLAMEELSTFGSRNMRIPAHLSRSELAHCISSKCETHPECCRESPPPYSWCPLQTSRGGRRQTALWPTFGSPWTKSFTKLRINVGRNTENRSICFQYAFQGYITTISEILRFILTSFWVFSSWISQYQLDRTGTLPNFPH